METSKLTTAFAVLILSVSLTGSFSGADDTGSPEQVKLSSNMDKETNTLLIDKLERVLEIMEPSNDKRSDVMLRLADLHAERGRLEDLQNGKENADGTTKDSKADRGRAIELYQNAVNQASPEAKGKIVFQMAQLYDLLGQYQKAQDLYKTVAQDKNKKSAPAVVGQAYTKLGDVAFNKIKYAEARQYFNKALAIPETPKRDYIKYRLAWCSFHEGDTQGATTNLTHVLKDPALQNENSQSFREEASRDLATFMSRGKVGESEVQTLSIVSPLSVRHDNLIYLSDELNRLGKKGQAVYVLTLAGPGPSDKTSDSKDPARDKIEEHLKLAELQYDIGKKDQVIIELQKTVGQWKMEPCKSEDECGLLKERFKKLVVAWGKAEEKHPSAQIVQAYTLYNSIFADAEMNYWAALAARANGQYKESAQFYRNAATLASNLKVSTKSNGNEKKIHNILEGSLLGEIEVAELSHDSTMRDSAYNHYLEMRPNSEKALEVQYQKAHLVYEQEKYADAANMFRSVALSKNSEKEALEIRRKAAHLSLDSLVLAKNSGSIQEWAGEYARVFHTDRAEFLEISKKATFNHIAVVIDNPNSTQEELRSSLNLLNQFPVAEATRLERIAFYKNKLIIAERLKDLGEAQKAIVGLLSLRKISETDREYALSRQEWIDELTLKFNDAYKLALQLPLKNLSREERDLKLAMLAELSNHNPQSHYEDYLKIATDREKSQTIIANIVRRSHSVKTFLVYEPRLRSNPELLATLALELFALHHDFNFARQILKTPGVTSQPAGQTLSRFVFLNEFHKTSEELSHSYLEKGPRLKASIDRRLALMKRTEGEATRAVNSQDWVLQVIVLNDIAYHYKLFALEMMRVSVPRGLSSEQAEEFHKILFDQAHFYKAKAESVAVKTADLWKDSSSINTLFSDYQKTHGELRAALREELRIVARVAPVSQRSNFIHSLSLRDSEPSTASINQAKISVSHDPFNSDQIEKLKILEERAGSETIVAFLDARLVQLKNQPVGVKQ